MSCYLRTSQPGIQCERPAAQIRLFGSGYGYGENAAAEHVLVTVRVGPIRQALFGVLFQRRDNV